MTGRDLIYGQKWFMRGKNEGKESPLPVTRGTSQNVLGFMWHRCQKFSSFVFEGSINSNIIIACFDEIAQSIEKETVVTIGASL